MRARIGTKPFFYVLGLLAPICHSSACNLINSANSDLQKRLEIQDEIQNRLDDALKKETNRCQAESGKVSSRTAQLAEAQSCVALQESATYNRELKDISHDCTGKIDGLKFAMEFVRESTFKPFQKSIDLVVQEDGGDSFLQSICPGQISDTSGVLDRTNELLDRSKRSIAKAKNDYDKFAALEGKVTQFELATQAGWDRCVAEGEGLGNQQVFGQGSRAPATDFPHGTTPKDESTITGVEQDAAKRAREKEILGF